MGLLDKIEKKDIPNKVKNKKDIVEKSKQQPLISIETDIDKLHNIVLKYKSMSLKDAATILKTDTKRVEELAKILDKHNIAELYYPPAGSAIIRQIDKKDKSKKSNKKLNLLVFGLVLLLVAIGIIIFLKYYGIL